MTGQTLAIVVHVDEPVRADQLPEEQIIDRVDYLLYGVNVDDALDGKVKWIGQDAIAQARAALDHYDSLSGDDEFGKVSPTDWERADNAVLAALRDLVGEVTL